MEGIWVRSATGRCLVLAKAIWFEEMNVAGKVWYDIYVSNSGKCKSNKFFVASVNTEEEAIKIIDDIEDIDDFDCFYHINSKKG